jgi:hypothetical protein
MSLKGKMVRRYTPQIQQCPLPDCVCKELDLQRNRLRIFELDASYTGCFSTLSIIGLTANIGVHETILEPVFPTLTLPTGGFRLKTVEQKL